MTDKQRKIIAPKVMEAYKIKENERFRVAEYVVVDLKFKNNVLYSWNDLTKKWVKDDGVFWKMLLDENSVYKVKY